MSRINTNVTSQIAQRVLTTNQQSLNTTLQRLSTGLRINSGKDDPAGLIASENLRGQNAALTAAIGNADRTNQLANTAEGSLQEVSGLLTDLQSLITSTANDAGLSVEEKQANQLQVDSILQTIDRVASTSNFQGVKLLNGNFDFTTTSVASGVDSYRVNSAKLTNGSNIAVQAIITGSAQQGTLYLSTGATLDLSAGGTATTSKLFTIEVAGKLGSRQLSFASGTTQTQIRDAINTFTSVTGVQATISTGLSPLRLESTDFGSNSFVSVNVINTGANVEGTGVGVFSATANNLKVANASGITTFANAVNGVRAAGADITATINGVAATTSGKTASINTDFLDLSITFNNATSQARSSVSAFSITGGGAAFQLSSQVDLSGKVSLGIQSVESRKLGGTQLTTTYHGTTSTGFNFLSDLAAGRSLNLVDGDLNGAQSIVGNAINQVASLRGRIGAFQQNTVSSTINSLNVSLENSTAAQSSIRDADFASEAANLTRSQILQSASTQVLTLANSAPQNALTLLRGA